MGKDCNFYDDKIGQFLELSDQKKIFTIMLLKGYQLDANYFWCVLFWGRGKINIWLNGCGI